MDIKEIMPTYRFQVLLDRDAKDRVWVTYVPSLNFLSTFGRTRGEALAQTREAIVGYLETAAKEGISIPVDNSSAELVWLEVSL